MSRRYSSALLASLGDDPESTPATVPHENTNGLLRDYFPKGTDLRAHTAEHLLAVENELNGRPRRVLDDRSPATLFEALLRSPGQSALRR